MPSVIRRAPKLTDLDRLAEMVRQGASLAECDRLRPDLTPVQRRALEALRPLPRVEQLAAAGNGGRPWTPKEDAVLRAKIPARTADQIRASSLPWRPALQIRARAAELGLGWGEGDRVVVPSARPQVAGASRPAVVAPSDPPSVTPQTAPTSAPAAVPPAWTPAQDSLLAMQAGTVPFLVLRDRLAAVGPAWARQDIRRRMTQLMEARRIRPGRGLALRAFEKDVAVRVDKLCAKGRPAELIAREIGRGYTANMVRRLRPNALFAPERGDPTRGPVFVYPMTRESIIEELNACNISLGEWARRQGVKSGTAYDTLRCADRPRRTALSRALGLLPAVPRQPKLVYPMTPGGILEELEACDMSVAEWARENGYNHTAVRAQLRSSATRRSTPLNRALGLSPDLSRQPLLVYPMTRDGILAELAACNMSISEWARRNGFSACRVGVVLRGAAPRLSTHLSRALGLMPPREGATPPPR